VVALAQHLDCSKVLKSHNHHVFSCLSLAFSRLVHATLDPEPVVAQKAASLLDTLPHEALRAVLAALQLQFDCVIADRPYLLHTLRLLYTRQRHRAATLSWELFARRFNALCLEAQLAREPDTAVVDIYGQTEKNNAYLQRRTSMAKLALKRSAIIRHVRPETQQEVQPQPHQVLSALVSLLMTFMATCDSAKPSSASQGLHASADHLQPPAAAPHSPAAPEASAPVADKHQALLLRHLESLMCFSAAEQRFTAPSAQLRAHPCVHAFLAGLPAVLDRHLELGRLMLPTVLGLLRSSPTRPPAPWACSTARRATTGCRRSSSSSTSTSSPATRPASGACCTSRSTRSTASSTGATSQRSWTRRLPPRTPAPCPPRSPITTSPATTSWTRLPRAAAAASRSTTRPPSPASTRTAWIRLPTSAASSRASTRRSAPGGAASCAACACCWAVGPRTE